MGHFLSRGFFLSLEFDFLLFKLLITSLLFSSLPSYWSGSWTKVSHCHPCLLIGQTLDTKSPNFIEAFLLVWLLTTSLPFSSLPSYWSGSWLQVFHFYPCLLIGQALDHKSPIFIPAFLLVGLYPIFILIYSPFRVVFLPKILVSIFTDVLESFLV